MDEWFNFFLKEESSIADGLAELLSCGVAEVSVLEDLEEEKTFFCGKVEKGLFPSQWEHIDSWTQLEEDIDWLEQWELFCPYFINGMCKIPLSDFSAKSSKFLLLSPGAGFGDLSHPTTCLMMALMSSYVEDKTVVDLGCGSGVLGLFALQLGAKKIYGLDIDKKALEHTKENARLNHLEDRVFVDFELPEEAAFEAVLLNMTLDEQKQALSFFPVDKCNLWITSGILEEQEAEYLLFMKQFSLKAEKIVKKEGWLGFIFITNQQGPLSSEGDIPIAAI